MDREQILDLVNTDISSGLTLIEASAGSGKTFAISMFVLRAVVELKVPIEKIVVVTFTVAATEELRERVRARLIEGRDILRAGASVGEPVLQLWAESVDDPIEAVLLIELALQEIDQASIYTIHGFCQRMLTEQALESGELFDVELTGDGDLVKTCLVKDYWRQRLYQLEERYCSIIVERYGDPDQLYRSIAGAEDPLALLIPEPRGFEEACREVDRNLEALGHWWSKTGRAFLQCVDDASAGGFLKKELDDNYRRWSAELENSLQADLVPPGRCIEWLQKPYLLNQLNGNKLRGEIRKFQFIEDWPWPDQLAERVLASLEAVYLEIRLELANVLRKEMSNRLARQGKMSFDDLVVRLASAVTGVQREPLCRQIARRYQLVLIDEFQDTDSAQWQIFSSVFGAGHHLLYLIGDPKQAIYRFRGADIFSYYEARSKAERILTLNTNFRSHPQLMTAVNELFSGFDIAGRPYRSIVPAKKAEDLQLWANGHDVSKLIYCQMDEYSDTQSSWYGGAVQEQIKDWIAAEIGDLLGGEKRVEVKSCDPAGASQIRRVEPADIAILVRTNYQAEQFRDTLLQSNIPAVVASKKNVFITNECQQLLLVLQAVASPGSIKTLKTALACRWFSLTGAQHTAISRNEKEINKWLNRFQHYRLLWQEKGFLSMLNRLLIEEKVFISLCNQAGGERQIANIQHLGELVQEAEQKKHFGIEQTIQWLHMMSTGALSSEETELRLESDEDAVHIITMHGAKGLEYLITFCPHLLSTSAVGKRTLVTRCHDENDRLVIDIGSENFEHHRVLAEEELFQEDIRLTYVAATRAQLRCYLFWADVKSRGDSPGSFASPLGLMLFPDGHCSFESQQEHLMALGSKEQTEYRLITGNPTHYRVHQSSGQDPEMLQPRRRGKRLFQTNRILTSFSGLTLYSRHDEEALAGAFDERSTGPGFAQISRLPGGVRFGNVVHDALESFSFSNLAKGSYDDAAVSILCQDYGLDVDSAALKRLLKNCVTTLLSDSADQKRNFSLSELEETAVVKEMEFSLHMKGADTTKINKIMGSQQTFVPLNFRELEGFLNGFIDLICCHDGRFYVIDYKTNYLGDEPFHYNYERMQSAMRAHNYGLQYWLYTLVVHRYLSCWLPNYSYETHFGGVLYLFVRGMLPELAGSGVYYDFPDKRVLEQLNRCFGGE